MNSESDPGLHRAITPRRPPDLRIEMLGRFVVATGSRTIASREWRRRKAGWLVALLSLSPGFHLHREEVQEILWPGLEPGSAVNNLHRTLHAARRILEPELRSARQSSFLRLDGDTLRLAVDGNVVVDAVEFATAADRALRSAAPELYEHALTLYPGDLLPDEPYEDWIAARRQELRNRYIDLFLALARIHESSGDITSAIDVLQRLVSHEPANEQVHVGLMRLYALSGDQYRALRQYDRLREVLWREVEMPPDPLSEQLRDEILRGELRTANETSDVARPSARDPSSEPVSPYNLPRQYSSLIGREHDTEAVLAALRATRLLTLVGVGGSGKTRLGIHVANLLLSEFRDGVWLVDLTSVSAPDVVPQTVALSLGIRELPGQSIVATLTDYLAPRELLLVLDNCEHLAMACAVLAGALLEAAPRLTILTTSREPLHVPSEALWAVPPLAVPDRAQVVDIEQVRNNPSVRLFIERARQRRPDFDLSEENAGAVVEITRRLEGLPLALELAAARVSVLAAGQIAERLDDALGLLATTDSSVLPKHRTLLATLDWSHALLDEYEQALFRRLAVFAGGATIEAVESVCVGHGVAVEDVLDLLAQLVDRSLIVVEERQGQARYRLLEPVRQYAVAQLVIAGEETRARDRHLAWSLALTEEAEARMTGGQQIDWFNYLESEHDNLRTALARSLECRDAETSLQLGVGLMYFWSRRGYLSEGRAWLERALAAGEAAPARLRAEALRAVGRLALSQTDFERAESFLEESLALSRDLGDQPCTARALTDLGNLWWHRADYRQAAAFHEEALALYRALEQTYGIAAALHNLGLARLYQGDPERARELQQESLVLLQALGNQEGVAVVLHALGQVALEERRHDEATALLRESVELCRELGYKPYIAHGMMALAAVAACREWWDRAARLMGAAEALREAIGSPLPPNERAWVEPYLATVRAHVPAHLFAASWAAGRGLPVEEAIAEALIGDGQADPAPARQRDQRPAEAATRLTQRERQVAELLAQGRTNRQIAAALSVGPRTVETHVDNLLHKLRLRSRREVAGWLSEHIDPANAN